MTRALALIEMLGVVHKLFWVSFDFFDNFIVQILMDYYALTY